MARAATRYAKALLNLAVEKNKVESVGKDMAQISQVIEDNKELDLVLKNTIIKSEDKKIILNKVFSSADPLTNQLFDILYKNNRLDKTSEVAEQFTELYNDYLGKEKAIVTTAFPMTSELELKVLTKVKELTTKTVELENVVDESIIGGFILRIGDKQYNASVANKLNRLKREFTLN